jgi:RNA polymerase sigma-70 factor (ECF subfamily)
LEQFNQIYKENHQQLLSFARKMLMSNAAAQDVVQDVFVYYNERLVKGHLIEYPKSWLYKATCNKCIDYLKKDRRQDSLDNGLFEIESEEQMQDDGLSVECLRVALGKLKIKEKTLISLYSENLSYKEISELTGIKLSSVGKTISRVLKKIEKELKKQNYEMY